MRRRAWVLSGIVLSGLLVSLLAIGLHDMTNLFSAGGGDASGSLYDRLAGIADRSVVQFTHYGRKTGTPYEVEFR